MDKKKFAFVCLVMNVSDYYAKDRYVPGALVVAYSLKKYNTKHDIVLMHDGTISSENINILSKYFTKLVQVNHIYDPKTNPFFSEKQKDIYSKWISYSYTKWNALGLTEYERVCFLDADNLPLSNIDDLLEDIHPPASPFKIYSDKLPISIDYFKPFPDKFDALVPNELVNKALIDGSTLTAGLVVLPTGNLSLYRNYINSGQYARDASKLKCISGPDEISIAIFMMKLGYTWHNIPMSFINTPWKIKKGENIRMVTYTGKEKPWEMNPQSYPDVEDYHKILKEIKI